MGKTRKNSNRKANWKSNIVWSAVMLVIAGVLFMAVQRKMNASVMKVVIGIKKLPDSKDLIAKPDVEKLFKVYLGYDLEASSIRDLDLRDLESMLESDDRIKQAEIYVDNRDKLYVAIEQRIPIVRVYSKENTSYYLDADGMVIPAYKGSAIRVPIASGNIEKYSAELLTEKSKSKLKDVYILAKYIHEDEFLSALIEQIDVDNKGDITMVPKIGRQKLVFGDNADVDGRFDKLKLLYKGGLPNFGWRKYDVLTLKYDGQIVGERRQ